MPKGVVGDLGRGVPFPVGRGYPLPVGRGTCPWVRDAFSSPDFFLQFCLTIVHSGACFKQIHRKMMPFISTITPKKFFVPREGRRKGPPPKYATDCA